MRAPIVLLLLAAAGVLGGGALIGVWALGCCLIAVSGVTAWFALTWDWPERKPSAHVIPGQGLTVADVFDRARAA